MIECLDGAVCVPLNLIQAGEIGELAQVPKDTPIHVFCAAGGRAARACDMLKTLGFTDVHNAGGIADARRVCHL